MFQMCTSLTGAIFQSLGATRDMFLSAVVNTAITVAAICVGIAWGDLLALAILVSAAYSLNPVATYYYLLTRAFGGSLRAFARAMAPQLVVAAAMIVVGVILQVCFSALEFSVSGLGHSGFPSLELGFPVLGQLGFAAPNPFAYSAADLSASWLAPLPSLFVKVALCVAAYVLLLAATGQWRHLCVFVGR